MFTIELNGKYLTTINTRDINEAFQTTRITHSMVYKWKDRKEAEKISEKWVGSVVETITQ